MEDLAETAGCSGDGLAGDPVEEFADWSGISSGGERGDECGHEEVPPKRPILEEK
jgi:hypothetical protein